MNWNYGRPMHSPQDMQNMNYYGSNDGNMYPPAPMLPATPYAAPGVTIRPVPFNPNMPTPVHCVNNGASFPGYWGNPNYENAVRAPLHMGACHVQHFPRNKFVRHVPKTNQINQKRKFDKVSKTTPIQKVPRIYSAEEIDDAKRWREERKKCYPTDANIAKKKSDSEAAIERGELHASKKVNKSLHEIVQIQKKLGVAKVAGTERLHLGPKDEAKVEDVNKAACEATCGTSEKTNVAATVSPATNPPHGKNKSKLNKVKKTEEHG